MTVTAELSAAEGAPELDGESARTLRLAQLVSIAVRVEPTLLRAIRLRLSPACPPPPRPTCGSAA